MIKESDIITDKIDNKPAMKYQKPKARIIALRKLGFECFFFFNSLFHSLHRGQFTKEDRAI